MGKRVQIILQGVSISVSSEGGGISFCFRADLLSSLFKLLRGKRLAFLIAQGCNPARAAWLLVHHQHHQIVSLRTHMLSTHTSNSLGVLSLYVYVSCAHAPSRFPSPPPHSYALRLRAGTCDVLAFVLCSAPLSSLPFLIAGHIKTARTHTHTQVTANWVRAHTPPSHHLHTTRAYTHIFFLQ